MTDWSDPDSAPGFTSGVRLYAAIDVAFQYRHHPEAVDLGGVPTQAETPRWPSSIQAIDLACGGFYGFTVMKAKPKTGKSLLAFASAVLTAASRRARVVYFDTENTKSEIRARFERLTTLTGEPEKYDAMDYFHIFPLGPGTSVAQMAGLLTEVADMDDERVVIFIDSVNTLAQWSAAEDDRLYFRTIKDIGLWAMQARRMTEGAAGFCLVCETNRSGGTRGSASLENWADMVLSMKRGSMDHVDLDIVYSRQGGEGKLKPHLRNWKTGRFEGPPETGGLF